MTFNEVVQAGSGSLRIVDCTPGAPDACYAHEWMHIILYDIILCSIISYYHILYYITLYYSIMFPAMLYSIVLYYIM